MPDHTDEKKAEIHFATAMEFLYATAKAAVLKTSLMALEFDEDYDRGDQTISREDFKRVCEQAAMSSGVPVPMGADQFAQIAAMVSATIVASETQAQQEIEARHPEARAARALMDLAGNRGPSDPSGLN
jgi:hypothetical protein